MKRKGYILSVATVAWIGIMSWVVTVHPQAGRGQVPAVATPGQAPPLRLLPLAEAVDVAADFPAPKAAGPRSRRDVRFVTATPAPIKARTAEAIRLMTPEKIFEALSTGKMKTQAEGLTEPQMRRVAEFMAGRPMGSSAAGDAKNMPNKCPSNPTITSITQGAYGTAGVWTTTTRGSSLLEALGLQPAQVPNLKLKWAFGFPTGETSSSQPTVVAGRVFVGSDNGYIYSLDAATGCVYWSFEGGSIVRGALTRWPRHRAGNGSICRLFRRRTRQYFCRQCARRQDAMENESRSACGRPNHCRYEVL